MTLAEKLNKIPRGDTCPGVNRAIIEYLLCLKVDLANVAALDAPCGKGEFLEVLKHFFPGCETFGADIMPTECSGDHRFLRLDLAGNDPLEFGAKFKLVTSISGVMEFDNTLNFIKKIRGVIDDDGLFIVSNDNLLSVRDRVLYFFTGRFRQYPLFIGHDAPTWRILPLQDLLRVLGDGGFDTVEVRYISGKWSERLWLPIAIPIYVCQVLSFLFGRKEVAYGEKAARYPFASLFSRHYFVACRPTIPR